MTGYQVLKTCYGRDSSTVHVSACSSNGRALDLHSRGSGINAHHVHSFSSGTSVEVEYAKMRSFRAPFGLRSGTHEHMPTDDVNRGSDDARRSGRTEEIWNISDNEISTQVV